MECSRAYLGLADTMMDEWMDRYKDDQMESEKKMSEMCAHTDFSTKP